MSGSIKAWLHALHNIYIYIYIRAALFLLKQKIVLWRTGAFLKTHILNSCAFFACRKKRHCRPFGPPCPYWWVYELSLMDWGLSFLRPTINCKQHFRKTCTYILYLLNTWQEDFCIYNVYSFIVSSTVSSTVSSRRKEHFNPWLRGAAWKCNI